MTGHALALRLLLAKDLQILRRSPALVALLVLYPLLLALLVGGVISNAGARPRVAFVNEDNIPARVHLGSHTFNFGQVIDQAAGSVDLIHMSRARADHALAQGDVVAVLIVPKGFLAQLRTYIESPSVVLVTNANALETQVKRRAEALVYNLNNQLQVEFIKANVAYLEDLVNGGDANFLGRTIHVLGLTQSDVLLSKVATRLPPNDPAQILITDVQRFAHQATLALGEAKASLEATAHPIVLSEQARHGRSFLLGSEVQSDGLAISLTFMGILIAAGALTLEREENVLGRLARGLASPGVVVAEKIVLTAVIGVGLGVVLMTAFAIGVSAAGVAGGEPWARLPLLVPALALSGAAIGAFGAMLGVLARDLRTASVAGVAVAIPFILLGIIPPELSPLAGWLSMVFPFAPSAHAFTAVLFDTSPISGLARWLGQLALLTAVFGALARGGFARLRP